MPLSVHNRRSIFHEVRHGLCDLLLPSVTLHRFYLFLVVMQNSLADCIAPVSEMDYLKEKFRVRYAQKRNVFRRVL